MAIWLLPMAMLLMAIFAHGYMAVALSHIVANGYKLWLMAISRQNQQISRRLRYGIIFSCTIIVELLHLASTRAPVQNDGVTE